MEPMEQEFAEADRELQQMGYQALDRIYQAGAKVDDVQFVGWLAGLGDWTPNVHRKAA
jgi:hypothetical protein